MLQVVVLSSWKLWQSLGSVIRAILELVANCLFSLLRWCLKVLIMHTLYTLTCAINEFQNCDEFIVYDQTMPWFVTGWSVHTSYQ